MRPYASSAASAGLATALAAVAFGAKGGSELGRATTVEVALMITGGLVVALAVVYGPRERYWGGSAIILFVLLATLTGLSIIWSIQPELSWIEADRTLSYLAAFAAAVAMVRMLPDGWDALLRGILGAAVIVVGYALISRVFPGALAENELYARISAPFGYWNAVGLTAALGLPLALWLGGRRSGHQPAGALAYPATGMFLLAIFLSYSRGALLAAAIGAALWIGFVPLRLRSLGVLSVSAALTAPLLLWALSRDAFTLDLQPLSVRSDVALPFGLLLLLMLVALLGVGALIGFGNAHWSPPTLLRRRAGLTAIAVAAAIPLMFLGALAVSDRGIGGTIKEKVQQLGSESARTPGGPARLTTSSSSRGRYWRQAGRIFADRPVQGTGAGTFGLARLRYRKDVLVARHAHGFIPQTMADMGVIGLIVVLLLGIAWLVAAARTVGVVPSARGEPWGPERVGLAALALCALVFGVHSAIDFTWFVPGPAVMALVAAGWVAGRGPVGDWAVARLERRHPPVRFPPPRPDPERLMFAGAVVLSSVVCAWAIVQPLRSDRDADRAGELLADRDIKGAARTAQDAYDTDPLSPRALLVRAEVELAAGQPQEALRTLQRAVRRYPNDAETWQRLSDFQLNQLKDPQAALKTLSAVQYLDPNSPDALATLQAASATPTATP